MIVIRSRKRRVALVSAGVGTCPGRRNLPLLSLPAVVDVDMALSPVLAMWTLCPLRNKACPARSVNSFLTGRTSCPRGTIQSNGAQRGKRERFRRGPREGDGAD